VEMYLVENFGLFHGPLALLFMLSSLYIVSTSFCWIVWLVLPSLSLSLTLSSWAVVASGMSALSPLLFHGDTVGVVCGKCHCGVHGVVLGGLVSCASVLDVLSPSLSFLDRYSFMMSFVFSVSLVFA